MPVIGDCPYEDCKGSLWVNFDEENAPLPAFVKHDCETCERPIWTKLSRCDPTSWTEADFLKEFEVDEATKQIKERSAPLCGKEAILMTAGFPQGKAVCTLTRGHDGDCNWDSSKV